MSSDDEQQELEQDCQMRMDFMKAHPFPSYVDMEQAMRDYSNDQSKPQHMRGAVMTWSSEFGKHTYEGIKAIYESAGLDRDVNREHGRIIYDRGGMDALRAAYYIPWNFSPTAQIEDVRVRSWSIVSYHWHGIGLWQA